MSMPKLTKRIKRLTEVKVREAGQERSLVLEVLPGGERKDKPGWFTAPSIRLYPAGLRTGKEMSIRELYGLMNLVSADREREARATARIAKTARKQVKRFGLL